MRKSKEGKLDTDKVKTGRLRRSKRYGQHVAKEGRFSFEPGTKLGRHGGRVRKRALRKEKLTLSKREARPGTRQNCVPEGAGGSRKSSGHVSSVRCSQTVVHEKSQ